MTLRFCLGQWVTFFAQSQGKLVDLVLTKQVAAGAFSNDDYAALDGNKKANISILAETASLPRHLVSVRKNLDPALAKGLEKILLGMHEDPKAVDIGEDRHNQVRRAAGRGVGDRPTAAGRLLLSSEEIAIYSPSPNTSQLAARMKVRRTLHSLGEGGWKGFGEFRKILRSFAPRSFIPTALKGPIRLAF